MFSPFWVGIIKILATIKIGNGTIRLLERWIIVIEVFWKECICAYLSVETVKIVAINMHIYIYMY